MHPPAHGRPRAAQAAAISSAIASGPRLASIDLNPVFALPLGDGAFAADAVIEVGG